MKIIKSYEKCAYGIRNHLNVCQCVPTLAFHIVALAVLIASAVHVIK